MGDELRREETEAGPYRTAAEIGAAIPRVRRSWTERLPLWARPLAVACVAFSAGGASIDAAQGEAHRFFFMGCASACGLVIIATCVATLASAGVKA